MCIAYIVDWTSSLSLSSQILSCWEGTWRSRIIHGREGLSSQGLLAQISRLSAVYSLFAVNNDADTIGDAKLGRGLGRARGKRENKDDA